MLAIVIIKAKSALGPGDYREQLMPLTAISQYICHHHHCCHLIITTVVIIVINVIMTIIIRDYHHHYD